MPLPDSNKIHTVTSLANGKSIVIRQNSQTHCFLFLYRYNTAGGESVRIVYVLSDKWIKPSDGELEITATDELNDKMDFSGIGAKDNPIFKDMLRQYAVLFCKKNENYFKTMRNKILSENLLTKAILPTTANLNQKTEIALNKPELISCALSDLLI